MTLPESFKKSVRTFMDAGWDKVGLIEELGGMPAPKALMWAVHEHVLGANPAVWMYAGGAGFAQILPPGYRGAEALGRHGRRKRLGLDHGADRAGRRLDVGAGRTKAVQQDDGTWHIDGVKRFITSGDSDDLFENIFHLVLARPEGAGPGTRACLYSSCRSSTSTRDRRTRRAQRRLRHQRRAQDGPEGIGHLWLTFGQHGIPAKGWLIGDVHDGIAQMFDVIEQARMMVGTKAIATLSTGYLNALEYAKERVQGADLTQMMDKTAPRVTITHHPDVRRSLMTQKAYAEGLRALYLFTATFQDAEVAKIVQESSPSWRSRSMT